MAKKSNVSVATKIYMGWIRSHEVRGLVDACLDKLPRHWRFEAWERYKQKAKADYKEALKWLHDMTADLDDRLDISASDDDIVALSKVLANECMGFLRDSVDGMTAGTKYHGTQAALGFVKEECAYYSVRYPLEFSQEQVVARVTDSTWWVRGLRLAHAQAREVAAIKAGRVHRHHDVYCSNDTVQRRADQLARNAALMADIDMVNTSTGEVMALGDIAKAGVSNQQNRKNELVTRVSGMEQASINRGDTCAFLTITCPSRMHSINKFGKANKKYDGTTPAQAQKYLTGCWSRVRAAWARAGIKVYGLRVAEPHHDGTPHWHMVIFCKPNQYRAMRDLAAAEFYADSYDELLPHNHAARFTSKLINRKKGSAVGYVLKYIQKNIGGLLGRDSDEADMSSVDAAVRVEAWASTWRIRQFQQIGGHQVGVWRELRRVDEEKAVVAGDTIFNAWKPAQRRGEILASYAEFLAAMGGLDVSSREGSVAVLLDYERRRGRYGDTVAAVRLGVCERFGTKQAEGNRDVWQRVN